MGIYINPGNSGFAEINDQDYVDKTLLIDLINKTVEKKNKLTCISRPRRFGKSYAAKMLTAYYDCTCDSRPLFADKKISQTPDYAKYLNQYNVICLDITAFISEAKRQQASLRIIPNMIVDAITKELGTTNDNSTLNEKLIDFVNHTHKRIIFIDNDDFDSYWTETSAAESLLDYISKDYNGLTKTIAELIGGLEVKVDTIGFANDLTTFRGKNDVLTLMIHLGYLAYDSEKKTVHIPNEEIKLEFQRSIHEVKHEATLKRLAESEQLFADTIRQNEDAVAAQIEKVHAEETAPLHYNKEDSLRSVIKLAYYTYRDHYLQFEELPAGEGYADIVYLPKHDSDWTILLIELKWNHQNAQGAIEQIMQKKYPAVLQDTRREILLVGINYNKDAKAGNKKHTCKIVSLPAAH